MKQTSAQDLLDNQIIQISFNDEEEQYPSMNSKENLFQSVFHDQGVMHKVIKKSSFVFQDSISDPLNQANSISQSFSDLNGSIQDEPIFKSKLKVDKVDKVQKVETIKQSKQTDFWDLNRSMFTEKPGYGLTFNRNSEDKDKHETKQQHLEMKPFQMSPVHPKQIVQKPHKKQIPNENEIKVILRSTNYFLQKLNSDSVVINGQMLRQLYDQFFKKEIFIPLFKYQKFDQWNNSKDKFDINLEAHRLFKKSLERYVKYLNSHYPKEFAEVFKVLEQVQKGKASKKRQQLSFGFFNFDFTAIVQSLKNYVSSSKTEILRKSKLAKIRSLRENIKIAQSIGLIKEVQMMAEKIEEEWDQYGEIELLLNFQETEYYCTKKIQSSPQAKFKQIWTKYREYIRGQKLHHSERSLNNILI